MRGDALAQRLPLPMANDIRSQTSWRFAMTNIRKASAQFLLLLAVCMPASACQAGVRQQKAQWRREAERLWVGTITAVPLPITKPAPRGENSVRTTGSATFAISTK